MNIEQESHLELDPRNEILHIHDLATDLRNVLRANNRTPESISVAIDNVDELEKDALKRFPEVESYIQEHESKEAA